MFRRIRTAAPVVLTLLLAVTSAAALTHSPASRPSTAAADDLAERHVRAEVSRSARRTTTTTAAPTTTTSTTAARPVPGPAKRPSPPKPPTSPKPRTPAAPPVYAAAGGLPAGLLCIRHGESGDNYAENTGNGYYGAYQYLIKTWNNYGADAEHPHGYPRADLAPPAVQDRRALADYQNPRSRHQHWPQTSVACHV